AAQSAAPSSPYLTPAGALNPPVQDSPAQSASPQASATTQTRVITTSRSISFSTVRVSDSQLAKGSTKVQKKGVRGIETLTYKVTFVDGVQTRKVLTGKRVVKKAVSEVIAVGTKETQQCDPNYSGACVPIASDVDCAGGSGNGPAY